MSNPLPDYQLVALMAALLQCGDRARGLQESDEQYAAQAGALFEMVAKMCNK